jgi:ferredoxin, 2Fe-2S
VYCGLASGFIDWALKFHATNHASTQHSITNHLGTLVPKLGKNCTLMPKITYIEHNGKEHVVDAPSGQSVMEAAVKNAVPGIDAECGGACACATCHVYVDEAWIAKAGEANTMEQSMLEFTSEVQGNSRLACQIKISNLLDGLIVRMPASQH